MGHGCGPARLPELESAAKRTLPRVDVIAVREGRFTPRWLKRWGVASNRITVTGDDTVELAHGQRPDWLGQRLGVSLPPIFSGNAAAELRAALLPLAAELKSEFLPCPISFGPEQAERAGMAELFAPMPSPNAVAGGRAWQGTEEIIAQFGQCRVVVSGSHQGAVFALAQGISAVCLANTRRGAEEFLGLAGEFGAGCQPLALEEPDFPVRLRACVRGAWERAEELRPALLRAAARQIEQADAAYTRAFSDQWLRRAAA